MSYDKLKKFTDNEKKMMMQFFDTFGGNIENYEFTYGNCSWDGQFQDNIYKIPTVFETKVRNFNLHKYDTYIIEAQKLNNLAKHHNQGKKVKYFNFFKSKNGTYDLIIFNLSERIERWRENNTPIEEIIEKKWMNSATYRSKEKVEKEVIMLEFDSSIDMKIEGTNWSLN